MAAEKKKGVVSGSVGTIVGLALGVGITVLLIIFIGTLSGSTYNAVESKIALIYGTVPTTNNVTAAATGSYIDLKYLTIQPSTLVIQNKTSGDNAAGNFSLDAQRGYLTTTGAQYSSQEVNVSFTYGNSAIQNSVKNSIKSGFSAFEATGSYMPIVVLAYIIAVVLVLVLGFAAIGGRASGGAL